MRILLTGASSFTGAWFVRALADAGHEVTATFRGTLDDYDGTRRQRVSRALKHVKPVWEASVGDERFLDLVASQTFDLFCHHAAEMANYRSWDFDALAAAQINNRSSQRIIEALAAGGCSRLVLTGSVFEPFEGVGDSGSRAFSPYGLSKHISYESYRLEAERIGIPIGKFVIPNPFGALEEGRFTSYLTAEWLKGQTPTCRTPAYIRDNIPVDLLANAYLHFCEERAHGSDGRARPSGYIETQGAFALRVAREFGLRTGKDVTVALAEQRDFPEPVVRINNDPRMASVGTWVETKFWDEAVDFWTSGAPAE